MLQTLFAALLAAAPLSLSALPAHGLQADVDLEALAAPASPGATVQSYGPGDWFGGGELFTWEVQQFPGTLESIQLTIAIEGESSFTLEATGGTMHLDWAGVGLRVWTPREMRDFLAESPGPITATRLGRDEPWVDDTSNPLTDPDLELVGYSAFCWPLGDWNRTGIGTPPQGMHARWPTSEVPWTTHVDQDRQSAVTFHQITDRALLEPFEGNGTAILTLAPLRDWQVTQVEPPFVSYIPIAFRRRIEGISLVQIPAQGARAEPADPRMIVWYD